MTSINSLLSTWHKNAKDLLKNIILVINKKFDETE